MGETQDIGDIHNLNYLEHFNPKDSDGAAVSTRSISGAAGGQYYMDNTGQYYLMPNGDDSFDGVGGDTATVSTVKPTQSTSAQNIDSDQIMLQNGEDDYQTVTIVPNNSSSGEMSYVLIVNPPNSEEKKGDTVYNFENEDAEDLAGELSEAKKSKKTNKKVPNKAAVHICSYCDYSTNKKFLLVRHMRAHSNDRPHKCNVCERGFKTMVALQNHVNTHTGVKPYRCKYCMSKFTTTGEMVRHIRYKHTREKPHKCTECDYECVEFSKLKRHMRCHTGERPYQCPNCTYASPDTFKLKRHMRTHTGEKPYECDICQAKFTQSNSLKSHRAIHTGDKPMFKCQLCPTTCGRKTDLRVHVQKLHTSDRPVQCKMCDKTFPDRYSLKQHKKIHDGEKCYKCDLCPYSSVSSRHLESHMLIHSDSKPYHCDQCSQSFRQKQLLKRHQNLYHNPDYQPPIPKDKPYECPLCNRGFRHKGNLLRHQALLHDPVGPARKKQNELKEGRQKRLHVIDGQKVEILPATVAQQEETIDGNVGGGEEMYEYDYVVINVSQLQNHTDDVGADDDGTKIQVLNNILDPAESKGAIMLPSIISQDSILPQAPTVDDIKLKKIRERANCFGFDEDDDDDIAEHD